MYSFSVCLTLPVDQAKERLLAALQDEKLGVVSEVDVQAVMKAKLGLDVPAYRLLGACAAPLAKRVIDAEPSAGALLPCTIVLRDAGNGATEVIFMDPEPVLGLSENETVRQAGEEAKQKLERVRGALQPE